jgi:DMSO reductase family type II enzyme chaperone
MTPTGNQGSASDVASARSAAYGLLARAFRYPDSAHWSLLTDRQRWRTWPKILNRESPEAGDALRRLQERFLSPDPGRLVSIAAAQATYSRLFGHAVKGACPAYELEYATGEIFQRVASLADLQGFYGAFGLELKSQARERADHVSVECEFMSVLAAKEAYAEQEHVDEALRTVREAAGSFLEAHLGRWTLSLARRITDADPGGLYGSLGEFARSFIRSECRRYDVSAGPQALELRSSDEVDETVQRCAVGKPGAACSMTASGPGPSSPDTDHR